MKFSVWLGIFLLAFTCVSAQQTQVQKEKNLLFIEHTVQPKESLYSLARIYHLSPKEIAQANKLKHDASLQIGQVIRIPLTTGNFVQAELKNAAGLKPLYHTIGKGDNLYQLGRRYNNVPQKLLVKWNGLSEDIVKQGQEVIVGYLRYSPVAPELQDAAPAEKSVAAPVADKKDSPRAEISTTPSIAAGTAPIEVTPASESEPVYTAASGNYPEGYFAAAYASASAGSQARKMTGTAATFKSTSGWNDNKYYLLVTGIPENTIVKVTANGRTIYAKVLEKLPELRENNGLVCRMSNAASSALGINDTKFEVELVYNN
ncbi:MAG TPA: LysM peptidoglycan-binding domain-containing protein [Chitinophagaceae bacterium]